MGTATIQVRVLAVAGPRVWVAASGTLGGATLRVLHYSLGARVADEGTEFYLDLKELCCDETLSADAAAGLLPVGGALRFHLVAAREEIRSLLGTDPRCRYHPDVASAWAVWSREP